MIRKLKLFQIIIISLLFSLIMPLQQIYAVNDFYNDNDILFFDENASNCLNTSAGAINQGSSSSGYDKLKEAVRTYGETAMAMQRKYGTPWEVVLAQMQVESQVGTTGIAISGATNNWLGITGKGDNGSWISESGREWAKYSDVSMSVMDWAGTRVLRNGYYDDAFAHLDPNNYNLDSFLTLMLSHYAPNSDGNNETAYKSNVLSIIDKPIREVRLEKNWPSSAELAKKENIGIGGENPLNTKIESSNYAINNCMSAGNGDINITAINLAWPDRTHSLTDPKPEYKTALEVVGLNTYPDDFAKIGASCDAFVAAVFKYSKVDEDFACCGTVNMLHNYLAISSKYTEIPNLGNTSNLQPGDIFILEGHIMLYIKLEDGSEKIASASYGDRTADYASGVYFSDDRGYYRIFRYKG